MINSTSIIQQPTQHTIPTSPIAGCPQGIDPHDPTIQRLYADKKIKKSLLDRVVLDSVSKFMGTPPKHDNLNLDNSETSSVASDSSHIDFQASSTTNKDLKYTQQDLEKIKADIEKHYKIQVAIEKRNFEKEIQNYYHNHFKTIENEHKENCP